MVKMGSQKALIFEISALKKLTYQIKKIIIKE